MSDTIIDIEELVLAAAKYGFEYRDKSQHDGFVPEGNVLQWLQWRLPTYTQPVPTINWKEFKTCFTDYYSLGQQPVDKLADWVRRFLEGHAYPPKKEEAKHIEQFKEWCMNNGATIFARNLSELHEDYLKTK